MDRLARATWPIHSAGVVGDGMPTRIDGKHGKPVRGGKVGFPPEAQGFVATDGWRRGS